jgi:hypothetical protein
MGIDIQFIIWEFESCPPDEKERFPITRRPFFMSYYFVQIQIRLKSWGTFVQPFQFLAIIFDYR